MFRRQAPSALLLAALTLVGCGGGSHSSATSPSSATTTTSTTGSGATATRSASAGSGGAGRSSGASSSGAGASGASGAGSGASGGGGAINARVPATYHLGSGGRLTPPTISVPAFIAVEITIASSDARPHTVQVRTPVPHTLRVPARGRAAVRIPGLRAGTYPITVDGARRGTLAIGGEPGP